VHDLGSIGDSRRRSAAEHPCRRPDIETESLDDQVVLIDPTSGEYHLLNRTGFAIWQLCDGTHSVDDLVEIIAEHYAIGYERAVDDVTALIERLKEADLLGTG
jgi:hypothetical protein